MKILFTADLHLDIRARSRHSGLGVLEAMAQTVEASDPAVVVVAGDIGRPKRAEEDLARIRQATGDRPVAVALGNHDFWIDPAEHRRYSLLEDIVTEFWLESARRCGVILLDRENLEVGDGITLVGGYGHFDLGQAEPGLRIGGVPVTEEIYLAGGMGRLFWNDFLYIPDCAARLLDDARRQAAGIAARMDAAIASGHRLLVATHTCPWRILNGHPLRGTEQDILSAYSGNSLVGKVIKDRAGSVDFLMCGHTHMPVTERRIHGLPGLNVGADYGCFRGVIYDTDYKSITWVGEPVRNA